MNHRKRIGKLMLAGLAASLTLSITQVQGSTLDTLTQEEQTDGSPNCFCGSDNR